MKKQSRKGYGLFDLKYSVSRRFSISFWGYLIAFVPVVFVYPYLVGKYSDHLFSTMVFEQWQKLDGLPLVALVSIFVFTYSLSLIAVVLFTPSELKTRLRQYAIENPAMKITDMNTGKETIIRDEPRQS